jgi:hypothetical protein
MSEPSLVQPFPALPIGGGHHYIIGYTVIAGTELEAIDAAVRLLRTDVKLRGVDEVRRVTGPLWKVSLSVEEDD